MKEKIFVKVICSLIIGALVLAGTTPLRWDLTKVISANVKE